MLTILTLERASGPGPDFKTARSKIRSFFILKIKVLERANATLPGLKKDGKFPASATGRKTKDEIQTKRLRGGDKRGSGNDDSAKKPAGDQAEAGVGAVKAKRSATGGNSNFSFAVMAVDFFSDFSPAAIARQSGQRCFPSKVWET